MVRAAVLVVLVAAAVHADAPKLPAHVAPLFEKGRVWVYDTAITSAASSTSSSTPRAGSR